MSLPFVPIAELLRADDVQSYQHEQRIADRLLDAKLLVSAQHVNDVNPYYAGHHDSPQIPIAMGIYTLAVNPLSDDSPLTPELQRNVVNHSWSKFVTKATTPTLQYFQLLLTLAPNLIATGAAVTVRLATPARVTPTSNLLAISPYVARVNPKNATAIVNSATVEVQFGPYDVPAIVQIGVVVHGYVDPAARNAHR